MQKRQFIKQLTLGTGGCLLACNGRASNTHVNSLSPDKHTREIKYYIETPRGAKCLLCPNECELKPNEEGLCHNHINLNNKVYSTAYGNPCAVNIDPVEKKPLFHFYPGSKAFSIGTAGCTFACLNCQNWEISQKSPRETKNIDLMPESVVAQCKNHSCKSIAYTYNEPLSFYEYTYDTSVIAKQEGIKNILVSNGFINKEPLQKLCKVTDAANIDLKSFSDEIYMKLNAGKLQPILDTLLTLKDEGVWLEITNLIVPGYTDNFDMISRMCEWLVNNNFTDNPLHFSRFYPQYKLSESTITPAETLVKARDIAIKSGMHHVYIGNVPGTTSDNTICPKCQKIIIERTGFDIGYNYITLGKCPFCKETINGNW
jgi:pyruvate formate lyase activating enzyme